MPAPLTRSSHSWRRAWFAAALIAAACGGVGHPTDAAPPTDAAADGADVPIDAATDAATDAPDAAAAGPTRIELVGGSARLTGGTYAVDVAIGVPSDPAAVSGGTTAVQAGTPVHP